MYPSQQLKDLSGGFALQFLSLWRISETSMVTFMRRKPTSAHLLSLWRHPSVAGHEWDVRSSFGCLFIGVNVSTQSLLRFIYLIYRYRACCGKRNYMYFLLFLSGKVYIYAGTVHINTFRKFYMDDYYVLRVSWRVCYVSLDYRPFISTLYKHFCRW